ncbi:MAG: cystathionine gamma-synthase [Planctomycetota bacterium]|nr:MAG: cystathionine gamma-synthase [Planctomycetota bacterium]
MAQDLSGYGFGTRAVHGGTEPEPVTGAIMTPVFQTSTYVQPRPAEAKLHEYSRTGNPTRDALEAAVATLEGAPHGLAFASGMAAIDAVLRLLSAGDHVVAGDDLYGGTYRLFTKVLQRCGLSFSFVDTSNLAAVEAALRPETRLLWVETPTNPLLKISDLSALAAIARRAGALFAVDNTFATPALQQPLSLGADLVVHSTTKYVGGHSDVVGGAVVTRDPELRERLAFIQNAAGAVPGPWDCFLTLRGLKTLHLRMERHCDNAEAVAAFLAEHPKVTRVHYPGLPSHPGHEVARRQMRRCGGMVSFELEGGIQPGYDLCLRTRIFRLAESLGGVESLVEQPATMTHASVEPEVRRAAGLADGLVRLSVGVEDREDLLADLEQALDAV